MHQFANESSARSPSLSMSFSVCARSAVCVGYSDAETNTLDACGIARSYICIYVARSFVRSFVRLFVFQLHLGEHT